MNVVSASSVMLLLGCCAMSTGASDHHLNAIPTPAVYHGCGCTFSSIQETPGVSAGVLFSSNYEGTAHVNPDGRLTTLTARRADRRCSPSRIGGRCTLRYDAENVRVTIKATATWVCPENDDDESCEVVRLRGILSARMGGAVESHEVEGECGC